MRGPAKKYRRALRDEQEWPGTHDATWEEGITSLHLSLTTACNLRCSYCCQRRGRPRRMEWATLRRAVDWGLHAGRPDLKLVLTGGEPLLAWPLIRRAVTYARERSGRRWPMKYVLLTNGLLLSEAVLGFLIDNRFEVQLSFDGIPAAQDLRAKDSFPFLDRLLDHLRRRHRSFYQRRVSVASTVVPRTVSRLADSFAYFLRKGVSSLAFTPTLASSNGWNPARIAELEEQYARICQMSVEHFRKCGRIPLLDYRGGPTPRRLPSPSRAMCGVMHGLTPALDVDGEVYGCSMLIGQALLGKNPWLRKELRRLRIGNLRDPVLFERLEKFGDTARASRFLTRKKDKYSSYGRCRACPVIGVCGVCPVSIGLRRGNMDPDRIPDFNCAFVQVTWRTRQRFLRESGAGHKRPAAGAGGRRNRT